MKTFIFKVKLKYDKRVWRKIKILGSQTLDDLDMAIQEAFNFDAEPQTPLQKKIETMLSMIRGSPP